MTALFMRVYSIIEEAVERGVNYGMHRAYKHVDNPSEEAIKQAINDAVMNSLSEVVDFQKYEVTDYPDDDA
jgi:hypothetical protein